jgi:hypothetical protein
MLTPRFGGSEREGVPCQATTGALSSGESATRFPDHRSGVGPFGDSEHPPCPSAAVSRWAAEGPDRRRPRTSRSCGPGVGELRETWRPAAACPQRPPPTVGGFPRPVRPHVDPSPDATQPQVTERPKPPQLLGATYTVGPASPVASRVGRPVPGSGPLHSKSASARPRTTTSVTLCFRRPCEADFRSSLSTLSSGPPPVSTGASASQQESW